MRLCAFVLLLVACSDPDAHVLVSLPHPARARTTPPGAEPATTAAGTAAEATTPPTTPPMTPTTIPTTTTTAPSAPRTPISPEVAANVQRLVREARGLEHEGNHLEALVRFDEALRFVPSQPRILCEAGFIAHRAGNEALAGRRIDAALAAFGEPRHVSERLRVPLAMCLYNRGLVAEAELDPRRAVEAFEGSIALRPNATVEAALARARTAAAALPATGAVSGRRSTVGGLPFASDGMGLATTDPAQYERALATGLRGLNWDGNYFPASDTTVVRQPIATDGHPSVLVHTTASSDGLNRLLVSWPMSNGYQALELRLADETEADQRVRVTEMAGQWVGEMLRIDLTVERHTTTRLFYTGEDDERCEDGTNEDATRSWTVLCRESRELEDPFLECTPFPTSVESSGLTSYSWCDQEEAPESTPPISARAVVDVDATGVTIREVRDPRGALELEAGHYTWSDVFARTTQMLPIDWAYDDE